MTQLYIQPNVQALQQLWATNPWHSKLQALVGVTLSRIHILEYPLPTALAFNKMRSVSIWVQDASIVSTISDCGYEQLVTCHLTAQSWVSRNPTSKDRIGTKCIEVPGTVRLLGVTRTSSFSAVLGKQLHASHKNLEVGRMCERLVWQAFMRLQMLSKCTLQTVPCIGLHFNAFQKGMEKVEVVSAVVFSLLLSPEQIISKAGILWSAWLYLRCRGFNKLLLLWPQTATHLGVQQDDDALNTSATSWWRTASQLPP